MLNVKCIGYMEFKKMQFMQGSLFITKNIISQWVIFGHKDNQKEWWAYWKTIIW